MRLGEQSIVIYPNIAQSGSFEEVHLYRDPFYLLAEELEIFTPKSRFLKAKRRFLWGLACMHAQSLQSCPTLCDPMDHNPPSSYVHGILKARILEWVVMPFFRGSSWPRVQTHISCVSCIAGWFFTCWATWEAPCEVLAPSIYFQKWILFSSV